MINRLPLTLNIYIIKIFLRKLFYVSISISLLVFIINLFDVLNKVKDAQTVTTYQILTMSSLQVPSFIADIAIFLILLSSMITLLGLSSKSEITVMRSVGLSMWRILIPMVMTVFVVGILFVFMFLPMSIIANKNYKTMESSIVKNETRDSFEPKNGIWLKQDNLDNEGEEIKIRANKIYRDNIQLEGVTIWFFDKTDTYYKKIDAKKMFLINGEWHVKSLVINDGKEINKISDSIKIKTDLDPEFIMQKIINNFEDVKLFSIIDLPKLISSLDSSGFSSRKFKVYFHSLLNQPFLFVCMVLIAAYFSINNIRNRNNMFYIIIGVIFGLVTYIGLNIINALGSSGILPLFMATWLITLLFLSVSILLLIKKDSIN